MKPIQKYITIAILFIIIVAIVTYLHSSQLDEGDITITSLSQSDREVSMPKLDNTGSLLNSPFTTGGSTISKTTEIVDPSPNIPQPNTLWSTKTRQINGKTVTYEFGKGNPPEVALTGETLRNHWRNNGKGYMTPQAERAMEAFLKNPSLPYFINKCYQQLDWYHRNPQAAEYDQYPQNLNIEHLLYIDSETGRKEFNYDNILVIAGAFNGMDNRLEEDESKRRWNKCLTKVEYTQHFLPLVAQFFWVWKYYGNQWDVQ